MRPPLAVLRLLKYVGVLCLAQLCAYVVLIQLAAQRFSRSFLSSQGVHFRSIHYGASSRNQLEIYLSTKQVSLDGLGLAHHRSDLATQSIHRFVHSLKASPPELYSSVSFNAQTLTAVQCWRVCYTNQFEFNLAYKRWWNCGLLSCCSA